MLETGIKPILRSVSEGKPFYLEFTEMNLFSMVAPKKRDPNLDNAAVKKYRDIVHLQANYLQREEIALVVTNERIWEVVLTEWMLLGRNPKNVLGMLRVYESMNGGRL